MGGGKGVKLFLPFGFVEPAADRSRAYRYSGTVKKLSRYPPVVVVVVVVVFQLVQTNRNGVRLSGHERDGGRRRENVSAYLLQPNLGLFS